VQKSHASGHFKIADLIKRWPILTTVSAGCLLAYVLVYFETTVGKKLVNLSWSQMFILFVGLTVAACNIFVPSRLDRFERTRKHSHKNNKPKN